MAELLSKSPGRVGRILRLVILVPGTLIAAWLAWSSAATLVYADFAPGAAPAIIADNDLLAIAHINRISAPADTNPTPSEIKAISRKALALQPLDPAAMRLLGGQLGLNLDQMPDRPFLDMSERISRRDSKTQLLLVVSDLKQEKPVSAMAHINTILTVRPELLSQILPQMIAMLQFKETRVALESSSNSPWFASFILQASAQMPDPSPIADILLAQKNSASRLTSEQTAQIASNFANAGLYPQAVSIASRAGLKTKSLKNFSPDKNNSDPAFAPLTWSFANTADITVSLSHQNMVSFDMGSDVKIEAMHRVTNLPSGAYRLGMDIRNIEGNDTLLQWQLQCFNNAKWTHSWSSDWKPLREQRLENTVSIPFGSCSAQRWSLLTQSGSSQSGIKFDAGNINLLPL